MWWAKAQRKNLVMMWMLEMRTIYGKTNWYKRGIDRSHRWLTETEWKKVGNITEMAKLKNQAGDSEVRSRVTWGRPEGTEKGALAPSTFLCPRHLFYLTLDLVQPWRTVIKNEEEKGMNRERYTGKHLPIKKNEWVRNNEWKLGRE